MSPLHPRKLKRVIIREEYLALTGNYVRAILLHQLEFRQKCAFDVDRYLTEEGQKLTQEGVIANILPANGWFYKKAAELAEETMLDLDETTIRRHLKFFIQHGWVDERHNPHKKWDRTMQYRLNLVQIKRDLEALGYQLEGWIFDEPLTPIESTTGKMPDGSGTVPDGSCKLPVGDSKMPIGSSTMQLRSGILQEQYQNNSNKHIDKHTHNTGEHDVSVCGSKYPLEECLRYAEHLQQTGQGITNPGGYATTIYRTGEVDSLIEQFLSLRDKTEPARTKNCPDCGGTGFWYPGGFAQGVARCVHARLQPARTEVPRKPDNSMPAGS